MSVSQAKTAPETKLNAIQQLERILKKATERNASDVHLKAGLPPIVRVHGVLYYLGDEPDDLSRFTSDQLNEFATSLMTTRQLERYENGEEIDLGHEMIGLGRFRINVCRQRSRPRLVCRHIPDTIRALDDLSLPPIVKTLIQHQRGLLLVTGSTGTGKSTTLAALIDEIAKTRSCHIVTIEDPIEFTFKDRKSIVTQREVGLDTPNFASAIKYAVRQDPDVILIGEMRDEETVLMALNSAETGHLVLSTLHTNDATETVNRILGSISMDHQSRVRMQLASVLIGVVSQRLLITKEAKARIPAVEILLNNTRVRDLILEPNRTNELVKVIEESTNMGMQTFDQAMMQLIQQDRVTKEEALNHCTNPRDFQMRLGGIVPGEWREQEKMLDASRSEQIRRILDEEEETPLPIEIENLPKSS